MDWYYAEENKRQIGPINEERFRTLVDEGIVTPDTLVWNETMTDWLPYSRLSAPTPPPPPGSTEVVSDTHHEEEAAEVVTDANALVDAVNRDGRQFEISTCLSHAWQLVVDGFFLLAGAALFVVVSMMVIGSFTKNPVIVFAIHSVIQGPILGGVYHVFIARIRGEPAGFEDIFRGFVANAKTLVFAGLVIAAPGLLSLPGQVEFNRQFEKFEEKLKGSGQPNLSEIFKIAEELADDSALVTLVLTPMLPAFYLGIILIHVIPLVVGTGLGVRDAVITSIRIVHSRFLAHLGLIVLANLVSFLGILACGFGFILTYPIYFAMLAYGYESLFGGYRLADSIDR